MERRGERAQVVAVADDDRGDDEGGQANPSFVLVEVLLPFHSLRKIPHSELKMMMLAMWSVQLENL